MIVSDTGPLIALARVERLDLLTRLFTRVAIPPAVRTELAIESGHPGTAALAAALANRILVQFPTEQELIAELSRILDPGEAEAIALAEQQSPRFLLIDDSSPACWQRPTSDAFADRVCRHPSLPVFKIRLA